MRDTVCFTLPVKKINGASPKTIALLFGKVYLFIYIPAFCIVFPLLKLLFNDIEIENGVQGMYSWDKMLFLFFIIAFIVFSVSIRRNAPFTL